MTTTAAAGVIAGTTHADAASAPMWTPVPIPKQAQAHDAVAELPGTRLWYWDTGGSGRPVILMHAATHSAAGWVYQQPALAKAGYRVISYSRRGYFRSDPGDPANPGYGADDLDNLIQFLKLGPVDLVGAALGGYFALDFALAYPGKVRTLTIVSSLMGITDADYAAVNARLRPKFFADLPHEFQELSPSYRAGDPEGLTAWLELERQAMPGPRVIPKVKQPLTWARLETIRQPTLLMTGESDLYTPPSLLRMQASHMRHAEVATIAEAGHSPYWEQPVVFNRILLGFLARHA
jgi:pimeloyl-ACP methyl ester carboxylesterase